MAYRFRSTWAAGRSAGRWCSWTTAPACGRPEDCGGGPGTFGRYGPGIGLAAAGVGFATVYYIWGWYGGEVICGSEAS
ncbi:hypothetical protein [Nonomuraea sp. B19D2]|uniref:hypothetical protein n=1 Tax=Nonomuraea sp. B19D2 TaxID=3159561 RepID=UPI0032DB3BF0